MVICCCFISIKSFLRHHAPGLIGEKPTYPKNGYYETPRSKGLVITKDVSINLSWQDDPAPRSNVSAGYIEMDETKQGPSDRGPTSESQEVIVPPISYPPAARKL